MDQKMIEQENQLRNKSRQKGRRSSGVETKELILDATREVAVKYGVSQLTIDAVAEAAGVSKGGVLYHFPSKKSLITALMQQYVDHLSQELETALSHQKGKSYPLVRAFIEWFRKSNGIEPENRTWGAAIFAVQAFDLSLMEPLQSWYRSLFQRIRDSIGDKNRTAEAVLAVEGLFMLSLYNISYFSDEELENFLQFLENSIDS